MVRKRSRVTLINQTRTKQRRQFRQFRHGSFPIRLFQAVLTMESTGVAEFINEKTERCKLLGVSGITEEILQDYSHLRGGIIIWQPSEFFKHWISIEDNSKSLHCLVRQLNIFKFASKGKRNKAFSGLSDDPVVYFHSIFTNDLDPSSIDSLMILCRRGRTDEAEGLIGLKDAHKVASKLLQQSNTEDFLKHPEKAREVLGKGRQESSAQSVSQDTTLNHLACVDTTPLAKSPWKDIDTFPDKTLNCCTGSGTCYADRTGERVDKTPVVRPSLHDGFSNIPSGSSTTTKPDKRETEVNFQGFKMVTPQRSHALSSTRSSSARANEEGPVENAPLSPQLQAISKLLFPSRESPLIAKTTSCKRKLYIANEAKDQSLISSPRKDNHLPVCGSPKWDRSEYLKPLGDWYNTIGAHTVGFNTDNFFKGGDNHCEDSSADQKYDSPFNVLCNSSTSCFHSPLIHDIDT